jgi:undecaprenyl-diphosphatase
MGRCPSRHKTSAIACGVFVGGAWLTRRSVVTRLELRCFQLFNRASPRGFVPVWALMQLGSLGGALVVSTVVAAVGHGDIGRRMAVVTTATWLGAKSVKPFVRRGRPAAVLGESRVLGRQQAGLGYPSGHAAVAMALAAVAAPRIARPWRAAVWIAGVLVGPARMYVGAHLPLDVAGGIALGLAVEAVLPQAS